jgi:hypothetical protein
VIRPVVAPPGTVAVTLPSFTNVKGAAVPLNLTDVTPVNLDPNRVTTVPTAPLVGEKLEIVGPVTVKFASVESVPEGFVTLIFPVVAPGGTVVLIRPPVATVNDVAAVPLKRTAVVPENPDPKIETAVPTGPLWGSNPVMFGADDPVTVKFPVLWSVPAGVVTETLPVVAPAGTAALICVPAPFTLNEEDVPLNLTAVAPPKRIPVIVTAVPTGPFRGEKFVMLGAPLLVTVKLLVVAVPSGVVRTMCPVVAPEGTVVETWVPAPFAENDAAVPLNRTDVVPVKPVPLSVTFVPTGPLWGLKLVMWGAAPACAGRTPIDATSTTEPTSAPNRVIVRDPNVLPAIEPSLRSDTFGHLYL